MFHDNPSTLQRLGPLVVLDIHAEVVLVLQVSWRQSGESSALITKWTVDDGIESVALTGTCDSWPDYWGRFLDMVPADLQSAIAHSERMVRD
jgi:hypothetical protein